MFKTRLISGIVLVAIALVVIITGGNVLLSVMGIISLIGMFELYRVFQIEKSVAGIVGYVAAIVFYLNLYFGFITDAMVLPLLFMIVLLAVYVWLIFLCSWGSDTCAYCVGMLIGKHKMSPILSPKKSIEGAVGGVVGAALLTALYVSIFRSQLDITMTEVWILAGVSAIGALISMVGDLAASAIKRNYDIKDYGKLIPGHGGILDRFDSVIITAPIIFFLASRVL